VKKTNAPGLRRSGERRGRAHFQRRRFSGSEQRAARWRDRRQRQRAHRHSWQQVGQRRQSGSEVRCAALLQVGQSRFQLAAMLANGAMTAFLRVMTAAGDWCRNSRKDRAGHGQREKRRHGRATDPAQEPEQDVVVSLLRLRVKGPPGIRPCWRLRDRARDCRGPRWRALHR